MSPRALVLSLGVSGFAVGLWLNTSLKPRSSSGDMGRVELGSAPLSKCFSGSENRNSAH